MSMNGSERRKRIEAARLAWCGRAERAAAGGSPLPRRSASSPAIFTPLADSGPRCCSLVGDRAARRSGVAFESVCRSVELAATQDQRPNCSDRTVQPFRSTRTIASHRTALLNALHCTALRVTRVAAAARLPLRLHVGAQPQHEPQSALVRERRRGCRCGCQRIRRVRRCLRARLVYAAEPSGLAEIAAVARSQHSCRHCHYHRHRRCCLRRLPALVPRASSPFAAAARPQAKGRQPRGGGARRRGSAQRTLRATATAEGGKGK